MNSLWINSFAMSFSSISWIFRSAVSPACGFPFWQSTPIALKGTVILAPLLQRLHTPDHFCFYSHTHIHIPSNKSIAKKSWSVIARLICVWFISWMSLILTGWPAIMLSLVKLNIVYTLGFCALCVNIYYFFCEGLFSYWIPMQNPIW